MSLRASLFWSDETIVGVALEEFYLLSKILKNENILIYLSEKSKKWKYFSIIHLQVNRTSC